MWTEFHLNFYNSNDFSCSEQKRLAKMAQKEKGKAEKEAAKQAANADKPAGEKKVGFFKITFWK